MVWTYNDKKRDYFSFSHNKEEVKEWNKCSPALYPRSILLLLLQYSEKCNSNNDDAEKTFFKRPPPRTAMPKCTNSAMFEHTSF